MRLLLQILFGTAAVAAGLLTVVWVGGQIVESIQGL
jgi:hypothetical protein